MAAMTPYPHLYRVSATGGPEGEVAVSSPGLATLQTLPPVEFGGPGDRWSPETLLLGALGDCFTLTFRAVARAAKLPWTTLHVDVSGTLDRVDGVSHFTGFLLHARLQLPDGGDVKAGEAALHKAERSCLIANSLVGSRRLEIEVELVHA
jgi:organic hydroperoxide reductase OsmC/OhrA